MFIFNGWSYHNINWVNGRTNVWTHAVVLIVLVESLGGFLFSGRHSCVKDFFAGHSGLYCGNFVAVSILCETLSTGFKWERASLTNSVPILVTVCLC